MGKLAVCVETWIPLAKSKSSWTLLSPARSWCGPPGPRSGAPGKMPQSKLTFLPKRAQENQCLAQFAENFTSPVPQIDCPAQDSLTEPPVTVSLSFNPSPLVDTI